jgi:hypothetical protein
MYANETPVSFVYAFIHCIQHQMKLLLTIILYVLIQT